MEFMKTSKGEKERIERRMKSTLFNIKTNMPTFDLQAGPFFLLAG